MRRSKLRSDEGSASLEFITVGFIMLVPLVYLVLAVATIQSAALAAEGAARQAARVFVQAAGDEDAQARAARAVEFALADHGVSDASVNVSLACEPLPNRCLSRGGYVTVSVTVFAALPLAPPVLGGAFPPGFSLEASATQRVSRFWVDR